MNYYFWNSLTNAGGYKAVELVGGSIRQIKMPAFIDAELSNGACQIMLKIPSLYKDRCVLIVKGFKYADTNRKFDAQGRDVNINLIIESAKSDCEKLARICVGILSEWDNCRRYLGESIEKANTELSYNINQTRYEQLLEYLATYPLSIKCDNNTIRLNTSSPNILLGLTPGATKDYYAMMKRTLYAAFRLPDEHSAQWSLVMAEEDINKLTKKAITEDYNSFESKVLGVEAKNYFDGNTHVADKTNDEIGDREASGKTLTQHPDINHESHSDNSNPIIKAWKWFNSQSLRVRYLIVFSLGLLVGLFF